MIEKTTYEVGGLSFTNKEDAEAFDKLTKARKSYQDAAASYEEELAKCTCPLTKKVGEYSRSLGENYQDEFDNWHQTLIPVIEHQCQCCGKRHYYGAFDGEEAHWRTSGKILVKKGVY